MAHQPRRKWSSFEKWGTGIAVTTLVVASFLTILVPEVRIWLRLEKPLASLTAASTPTSTPKSANPVVPISPPAAEPTPKVIQHSNIHVKGNKNVVGNTVTGNGNVLGNNNQVSMPAPVIVAPGSIGITGGTVTNPTVNNFGPPPRPPAVIHVCISDLQTVEAATGEIRQVYTLTTDSEITGPTYVFEFSGPIIKQTSASNPDMAMNINEKLASTTSFGFRLFQTWFSGQRINLDVHSLNPVRLVKETADFGESFVFQNGGCVSNL